MNNNEEEEQKIVLAKTLRTDRAIRCLYPTNSCLLSGGDDGSIRLWNYQGEIVQELIGAKTSVRALCVSGSTLFSGLVDYRIAMWSLESGKIEKELLGHSGAINCLTMINWLLWSCAMDHNIIIWNTGAGTALRTIQCHADSVWALHFNPSTHPDTVFSASSDSKIALHRTNGSTINNVLQSTHKNAFTPWYCITEWKGKIITSGFGNHINIWEKKLGWLFSSDRWEITTFLKGHKQAVWCLMVDSEKDRLFSGSSDKTIRVWDLKTMEDVAVLEGHLDRVTGLLMWKGSIWSSSLDGTIRRWKDTKSWKMMRLLWIGNTKNEPQDCPLATLPPELIANIIDFL